jgi:SET domain-containing protein
MEAIYKAAEMATRGNIGLCYPYTVRVTSDKGRGVFADAAIPKGATVWRHVPGQYAVYNERSFKQLLSKVSHRDALYVLEHVHSVAEFPGYIIRVFDDGVLINHSVQPTVMINPGSGGYEVPSVTSAQDVVNALLDSHFSLIAARDLVIGDELTNDYNADPEDPLYYDALCNQYGVSWEWL